MHCIQCGPEIEHGVCPSCKLSPISLYELNKEHNAWHFCHSCGNYLEDDEEKCTGCGNKRNQITDHLEYINCPDCNNIIDPVYECVYCPELFIFLQNITYIKGQINFINEHECPIDLIPGDFYHDKKNKLNYKKDKNGILSERTQPKLILELIYQKNIQKFNITRRVMNFLEWERLNSKRVKRLQKNMPNKIKLDNLNGELKINKNELESWFKKSAK